MVSIFLKTLKSHRTFLLSLTVGVMAIDLLIAGTFALASPLFQDVFEAAAIKSLLKTSPELGRASPAQAYVSIGYTHPVYIILPAVFVIGAAAGAIAGEIESGTILLLLTRPLARYKLLLARWLEMLLGTALMVSGGFVGISLGVHLAGIEGQVKLSGFALASVNAYFLFFAVGSIALLLSSVSSNANRPISIAAGVTLLFFFLDFLAGIWDKAKPFGPLSVFHYYQPSNVALDGTMPWRDLGILTAVGLACLIPAFVLFQRRDIRR